MKITVRGLHVPLRLSMYPRQDPGVENVVGAGASAQSPPQLELIQDLDWLTGAKLASSHRPVMTAEPASHGECD